MVIDRSSRDVIRFIISRGITKPTGDVALGRMAPGIVQVIRSSSITLLIRGIPNSVMSLVRILSRNLMTHCL
ncbi:MAG: hypothetical protein ACTSUH_04310 [Candidatus Thorarchaeota archaeon]